MTVRWKPLIILSGLFLIVAALGLLAATFELVPGDPNQVAEKARAEWKAGRFGEAQIHFQQALQKDPRNARFFEDLAALYADWSAAEPARAALLRIERLHALDEAAKYDKKAVEPRRLSLRDALDREDLAQASRWAGELVNLVPNDPDAHFALAASALDDPSPDLDQAREHLEALKGPERDRPRADWLRARIAREAGDAPALEGILGQVRARSLPDGSAPTDRLALLRLRQIDALTTTDPATAAERARVLHDDAEALTRSGGLPPDRLAWLGHLLGQVQEHIRRLAVATDGPDRDRAEEADRGLEALAEATYRTALAGAKATDLRVYQQYAEHLLAREDRARCLAMVDEALGHDAARQSVWADEVARLREIGLRAALLDSKDSARFDTAEPYLKGLLASSNPRHQAFGHLFRGIILLERAGLGHAAGETVTTAAEPPAADLKARAESLEHLKAAASGLKDVPAAQALYGVALLLTGEPALGRQYLQKARTLPGLEPRYQLWAAWAVVRSGYPEEAEPIVTALLDAASTADAPSREMAPTLHLLKGEIYQARQAPDDLRKARAEYQAAIDAGQPATPALQLRLAQIDVLLDEPARGMERIDRLGDQGGPAAEHLAVLILGSQKKDAEALARLAEARRRHPDSLDLAGLEAALLLKKDQPDQADAVLAAFIQAHPQLVEAVQMRARLLAETLNRPDDARTLLAAAAERSETSSPLVQLALLDLGRRDFKAASRTIARIRDRWKEAATADLLDAQLAAAQNNPRAAAVHLDAALAKDPGNKVARFWKARLDDLAGASAEAAKTYERLAREAPVKELDDGLSLTTAANWALATLALQNQDADAAIDRLESLLKAGEAGSMARAVRWQIVAARASKGQWPAARDEIRELLKAPETTTIERVRAANFYRLHGETPAAVVELDRVLTDDPGNTPAVALRAALLAETRPEAAAVLLRKAVQARPQPASVHLMLAAVENLVPPADTGLKRALAVIDAALVAEPEAVELVRAKYTVLKMSGDGPGATALVESKAKADPKGRFQRLLVDILRDERRYAEAEAVLSRLVEQEPDEPVLAAKLVWLASAQAIEAADRGDRAAERSHNDRTAALIRRFRQAFPDDLEFPRAECELAARTGQMDRALAVTQEIDRRDGHSPLGPTLRAQIASARGAVPEVARQYAEAVARAPGRTDLRLALGQANLALGRADDAVQQAEWLIRSDEEGPKAAGVLLKARALAQAGGSTSQDASRRDQAVRLVRDALAREPKQPALYHLIAEIQADAGDRSGAAKTLDEGLTQVPDDQAGLSLAVQVLTETRRGGQAPAPADIQKALALADRFGADDPTGQRALALAVGFHKGGQYDLALPWSRKAAEATGTWVAHLNYADLLLAKAEATTEPGSARDLFQQAVAQYDLVLKRRATSIEAVNNKAWILHQYLGRSSEALDLAEGLLSRVDPATLPPDFFDTLGAIQESEDRRKEAEQSYRRGLDRSPDHPVLNFHMGRLLAADGDRGATALPFLKKAQEARDALPSAFAEEVDLLVARAGR